MIQANIDTIKRTILLLQDLAEGDPIGRRQANRYAFQLSAALNAEESRFDMLSHLQRQRNFSEKTWGPGTRTAGVVAHIREELLEIEENPDDLSEWIDVVILALDGAWRSGHTPEQIINQLVSKQTKNEQRKWPDWRTMSQDQPINHDRSKDQIDHGICMERDCDKPAAIDYNGHGHWVCKNHHDSLERYFEEEYK